MRVAVIGDAMEDRYWLGTSTRMSPEVPTIPVVKIKTHQCMPGGAWNVAANLSAMGEEVLRLWNPWMPTKHRLILEGQQLARWDENDFCAPFQGPIETWLKLADAVVVADYLKGSITPAVVDAILKPSLPIFVDTKGDPSCWLPTAIAIVMFPNEKEYTEYRSVYDQFQYVVKKQGKHGLTLMSKGQHWASFPAEAKKLVSVNGAGDTVVAAFVSEWGRTGWNPSMLNRAVKFAGIAGGIACEEQYTSIVSREQVEDRRKGHI